MIKDIVDYEPVLDYYIMNTKKYLSDQGWEELSSVPETRTRARQYQADLEKLIELLQSNLSGDKVSLYDVYHYLQLQIATNRSEAEPDTGAEDDYTSILCMTVHKSKGLEFDTVILPYMHRRFPDRCSTEIIIDPLKKEVGWHFLFDEKNPDMKNDLYAKLKNTDVQRTREEETRILYVAMTRAINHLICIVHPAKDTERWSYLIEEVGEDEE